ncbi:MAG: hypothetical protein ING73_14435 [Rhodocyclaceae bacterium]|nr:hypothetical protein [Rhodocyclaceae bacterium]MCA3026272.1 hypothetical protein [Rhodocyclaceae bacterium]MCA3033160.1 hypothetical protein [Rhodocyclaceae bacterium]MCA3038715.1 hypothetical protein [Rhodocyclaceae bacterium]MCA3046910.1 hypothetical protein [Rhodocyclaceae bacterium]
MMRFAIPLMTLGFTLTTGLVWSASTFAQGSREENSRWYMTLNGGSSALNNVSANLQRPTQPSTTGKLYRLIGDGPRLFSAILFSLRPDALNMRA